MDQKVLAGIGNIYADEILFRARIHPERTASGLKAEESAGEGVAAAGQHGAAGGGEARAAAEPGPPLGLVGARAGRQAFEAAGRAGAPGLQDGGRRQGGRSKRASSCSLTRANRVPVSVPPALD